MRKTIAIDRCCGWPNLTKMPDGSLISSIFNQPCHGTAEGEVDCYKSSDGGETWNYHGTPERHQPEKNRMNVACGLAENGDFLAIVNGWDRRAGLGAGHPPYHECNRIPSVVCRSTDGGKTFKTTDFSYKIAGNNLVLVPYGDILKVGNRLACACYTCSKSMKESCSYVVFSEDDGLTWTYHGVISENNYHETALWFNDTQNGIALCRENAHNRLDQFVTTDGGKSWSFDKQVTGDSIHPAHITKLDGGKLLLSCGIRISNNWGIGVSISDDNGKSWGKLKRLCDFGKVNDGGYPSSVQLDTGEFITHYYVDRVPFNERYFVGQIKWTYSEIFN